jgi:hypothetical protein
MKIPLMKTTSKILIATILALGMLAFNAAKANADTILTFTDSFEVGDVHPDVPQSPADRVNFINFMIALAPGGSGDDMIGGHNDMVFRSLNLFSSLPAATTVGIVNLMSTVTSFNTAITGTFTYLFAHYGGQHSGTSFVWDISGLTGVITVPSSFGNYGLSGWSLVNPTGGVPAPDGGATIMLLGLGLSGLGMVRRFLKS